MLLIQEHRLSQIQDAVSSSWRTLHLCEANAMSNLYNQNQQTESKSKINVKYYYLCGEMCIQAV